ncbi:hypothetical protein CW751_09895 [Brumimicrobium salinarum]|uniref:Bacteriophage abortive infection AbiH n=1 Tax=Brumimicrobium salinarum TaxID=2058658 RepID=A0A2I0R1F2_9FLAO|nr:AbiH family protein [Brumimicrobium salinarum]PKR80375.1 hypothetical protein CW751_09895 [Brumimicrobium salinarum]
MNRLIIIGNGFDLAHGLKTKYEDFLLWYLKSKVEILRDDEPAKDRLCTLKLKNENLRGRRLNILENIDKAKGHKDVIKSITSSSYNIVYNSLFFKDIINEDRWVDIENIYYYFLKNSMVIGKRTRINEPFPSIEEINSDLDFLRDKFIEYLKSECNDFDFDVSESPYLNLFSRKMYYENDNSEVIDGVADAMLQSKTMILNFNYTNLIKKYAEVKTGLFETVQIHGSLDYPEKIVFGFGDELDETYQEIERLNENKFFEHIKSFRYFQDGNYQKLMAFVDNDPFEVLVLGHSLGLSDRTMLSQIFENDNLKRVQLYYHQGQKDFTEKTYEISRHFTSKGRMRELIVPFTRSEPMPQVEMNSKD